MKLGMRLSVQHDWKQTAQDERFSMRVPWLGALLIAAVPLTPLSSDYILSASIKNTASAVSYLKNLGATGTCPL